MRKLLFSLFLIGFMGSPAFADWTGKDASGATITFKNPGICSSVVCVPESQLVDSTGAATGIAPAPLFVGPGTGQTFPVSAASLPLPTGAAAASAFSSTFPTNGTAIGLTDGTNMQGWMTALIQGKTGVNGNNMGSVAPWLWNGASFDAWTGTAALGAFVNVKASVLPTGAALDSSLATLHTDLGTLNTTAGNPLAAGSALIGGTNLVDSAGTNKATVKAASTAPAATDTSVVVAINPSVLSSTSSAAINVSTITTTQLVALSGSTKIYVTSFDVIAGGTGNITFEYGTGASCGTGTTVLTGAYNLTAQAGISKGSGTGAVLVVPAGNALCVLTSAAVQMSGSVSYQQF